ncbi:hypothetical protein [Muribaculum intestinale]|uniref:Uncharacterized protein n=1 Tax=Muribaculum intestinale TaxID=1796646 RepID=A0A4S2FXZ9_9BACT|nr:hypothetical protein [Muribaculum intestinale]MYM12430.1 hypothetical protein [Muribaculum intestinale]RXE74676.1 hypothetical protein ED551_02255 [Muribaculaceae bacterium Isolate-013 (NCI)]TGY74218.1 hypothetical protein E5333_07270 [Muribaculum intestinale]
MNKFYNVVLLVLSWLFLVAAVVILIFLLSLNNGDMSAMWPMLLGSAVSALFFAALAWVARKTSLYIDNKRTEIEDAE